MRELTYGDGYRRTKSDPGIVYCQGNASQANKAILPLQLIFVPGSIDNSPVLNSGDSLIYQPSIWPVSTSFLVTVGCAHGSGESWEVVSEIRKL